jgi:hypothetical protein
VAINLIASLWGNAPTTTSASFAVPAGVTTQHLGIVIVTTGVSGTVDVTIPGWTQLAENPSGQGNSEFAVFARLGGLAAGNNVTLSFSVARATSLTAIWFNTGGADIAIIGTPGTRGGVSTATLTIPGITTTTVNQDVIVVSTERTTTDGTSLTSWTPSAPTLDSFNESTSTTDSSHFVGHFTKATAGATGNYVATYNLASTNAAGLMIAIAGPPAPPTPPKVSTFSQSFSTPLDSATWEITGSPSALDSRLAIPADPDSDSLLSWNPYDLTASSIFVQMFVPTGNVSTFKLNSAGNRYGSDNTLEWEYNAGNLLARVRNAGVLTEVNVGTYNLSVHGRFFRFRNTSGSTVLFETSIDATTWTQRASLTASWDLTNLYVGLRASGTTGQTAYFDNINIVPPAPVVTTIWSSEASSTALSLGWTTANVTSARAVLSTDPSLTSAVYSSTLTPTINGNMTARFTGLTQGTMYYAGLEVDGVLNANGRGNYMTLIDGLANSKVIAGSCNLTGSTHAVFTRIKTEAPDFFTHMGDVHYADSNVEATWRAAFKSSIESSTFRPMLQTVTMTYDWDAHDTGGDGSDKDDGWSTFAPQAVRELTGSPEYVDTKALYRTWVHAGVRYIEIDRYTYRDQETVANTSAKSMLGTTQRAWLINLLQTSSELAIVLFDGFPHYSNLVAGGRWGSYPDERILIGNAIAGLAPEQKSKIVTISGDSHAVHADDGTNAMWGVPNLCASPLNQTGVGAASGSWNIGNIDADDTRGYFSRLTWTYSAVTLTLSLTWDAVRDDGVSVMTWSKDFSTIVGRTGYVKDPTVSGGRRPFIRHRNDSPIVEFVDAGAVIAHGFSVTYDGGTATTVTQFDSSIDGGGVND